MNGEVNVTFHPPRTELFVSFFKLKFLQENSHFYQMVSFILFSVELSQWIKLPPGDIIAKIFLHPLVSHDYDIICKYVANTNNK